MGSGIRHQPLQIANLLKINGTAGYREHRPSPEAGLYASCYWFISGSSGQILVNPDACADIIFDLNAKTPDDLCKITGTFTDSFSIDAVGVNACGIRFYPGIMHRIIRDDAEILTGRSACLSDFNIRHAEYIAGNIIEKPENEIVSFFDRFIPELFREKITSDFRFSSAQNILKSLQTGTESELPFSGKTADRYCKKVFGLSQKKLSSIIRFQNSLRSIITDQDMIPGGYFDQAHFIKDFSKFSGMTPGEFKKILKLSVFYNTSGLIR